MLKGLPTVSTDMEELRKQFGKGEADTLQKRISKVELQMDELDGQLRQPGASPADVAYRRERQKRLEDEMILLRQQQLVMIKAVTGNMTCLFEYVDCFFLFFFFVLG